MHRSEIEAFKELDHLKEFLTVVSITGTLRGVTVDPQDDYIIECAIVAQATHIITGDRKHLLPLGKYGSIQIVAPAQFLQIVKEVWDLDGEH